VGNASIESLGEGIFKLHENISRPRRVTSARSNWRAYHFLQDQGQEPRQIATVELSNESLKEIVRNVRFIKPRI
jgi:hypothetical protein